MWCAEVEVYSTEGGCRSINKPTSGLESGTAVVGSRDLVMQVRQVQQVASRTVESNVPWVMNPTQASQANSAQLNWWPIRW